MATRALLRGILVLRICSWSGTLAAHYECKASDEVAGELMGETGVVCGPRCTAGTFECPLDVPSGATAEPQCLLQDIDQTAYCALFCEKDGQCPSGAVCWRPGTMEVGICMHPLSYAEWAQVGTRRKLDLVGVPSRAGAGATGFKIAKAYNALMSLKMRYGIANGDADVLTVEELLSVAKSVASASGAPQAAAQAPAGASQPPGSATANQLQAPAQQKSGTAVLADWKRDVSYVAGNVNAGLPGLGREVHDTVWNLEHLNKRGVCSRLMDSVLLAGIIYLAVGCTYKHQALGARGIDMIPHIGFWRDYPRLVSDGVEYAADLVYDALGWSRPGFSTLAGGVTKFGAAADDLPL